MSLPVSTARTWFCFIAIVLLALNLRPAMAAIGPLLDMIRQSTGLSHTQASLLTMLPVFMMGFWALFGRYLRRLLGERRGIALGGLLIAAACLVRWVVPGIAGLIATAVVVGIGIALVQVLLPSFIKRVFAANSSRVMGLYTTGIMGGAAFAAATAPIVAENAGWPFALAVWGFPSLAAVFFWRMAAEGATGGNSAHAVAVPRLSVPFSRRPRAWSLLVFFGMGTAAYTLVLAWFPPFYAELGWSARDTGFLLAGLTLTEVLAGFLVSFLIGWFPDRRIPLAFILILLIVGLSCLLIAPQALVLPACLLLGVSIGALFPLSLILTMDHVDHPAQAGDLMAFVQGGGYIIASFMPLLAGFLHDLFSSFSQAWMIMIAITCVMLLMVYRFSPASYRRALHS